MVKLRRMLALWAFVLMSLVSFAQENLVAKTSQGDEAAKEKFQFAVDKKLPATDVKTRLNRPRAGHIPAFRSSNRKCCAWVRNQPTLPRCS